MDDPRGGEMRSWDETAGLDAVPRRRAEAVVIITPSGAGAALRLYGGDVDIFFYLFQRCG